MPKMQSIKFLLILIVGCLLISSSSAITTTVLSTGPNNAIIEVDGSVGQTWLTWSDNSQILNYMTSNVTANSTGSAIIKINSATLYANQQYYFIAYDGNGDISAMNSFTTGSITLIPQTTYGTVIGNILSTGQFDPLLIMTDAISPYIWVMPIIVFYTILWFFIFLGIWIRQRDILVISIVGMLVALFIISPSSGISTGVSPEFAMAGQALLYISIASAIVAVFKR